MTITMPDGRLVRLVPQDGPPTEPGLYLAEYTPLHGMRHTVARDVFRHCAGSMILGPDETRLEWWARVETIASGGGLIRGAAVDGEANDQRGEGDGVAEPSTPGRGGGRPTRDGPHQLVTKVFLEQTQADREALRARVAELEAAARWVPVGERLPAPGSVVQAAYSRGRQFIAAYNPTIIGEWVPWRVAGASDLAVDGVTHWRPLPADPEVQP